MGPFLCDKRVMLVLFALCLLAVSAQNFNTCPGNLATVGWCDCAPANSGITLSALTFTPNPPQKGHNITGTLTAIDTYKTAVTGGTVSVLVEFLGIALVNQTIPLCTVLNEAHNADPLIPGCPVPPTTIKTVKFNQYIPDAFPSGDYSGQVSAVDQTNRVIQCAKFKWTIA